MDELDRWLDDTFAWIQSPESKNPEFDRLKKGSSESMGGFYAPSEMHWPVELLDRLPEFLNKYFDQSRDITLTARRVDQVVENLAIWVQQLLKATRQDRATTKEVYDDLCAAILKDWRKLYRTVQPFHAFASEETILRSILTIPLPQAVTIWRDLIIDNPPTGYRATAASVETLTQLHDWEVADLFPQLLAALEHPTTVASILDLSNWTMRNNADIEHPATPHASRLISLLDAVVQRLEKLESDPASFGNDVRVIQRVLDESVALCIALCDTLGLMQNADSKVVLSRAAHLKHRRIQCESAAALARMGDAYGKNLLLELAAEPVTRQRVLHYADELGLLEEIDDTWRTEYAKAESSLAVWLASRENFGIAPRHIELLDQRILMWPSYSEPQPCYLFRFVYPLVNGQYSNIGMAGPLVHAFGADMAELPEVDIYAAFAGWQADHPEIYEIARSEFNQSQLNVATGLSEALDRAGYQEIQISFLGNFMGESVIAGTATHESSEGVVVTDGSEILWYPSIGRARPVGVHEAYCIYKGRRFLRAFNPDLFYNSDSNNEYS